MLTFYVILFLACLAVSFLLSGMEAGVLALSPFRIQKWKRQGNPRARALLDYLEHPETFLWTILVGNTVSNIVAVGFVVVLLYSWLLRWPWAFVVVLVLAGILFYSFCELLPKMLFRMYPNRLCMALATPFRVVHLLLRPVVAPFAWASQWLGGRRFTGHVLGDRSELRLAMQQADHSLTQEERRMIGRVLDLPSLRVRHYAIPLDRAVCVESNLSVADYLKLCRQKGYSRMPVWQSGEKPRRLVGIVNLKSILYLDPLPLDQKVADFIRPPLYVNHDTSLEEALGKMQRRRQRLAVVCGHRNQEIGIVSLQDILGAVFGDVSL